MGFKRIYAEQDEYVHKMLSIKMPCPVCHTPVSLMEERNRAEELPDDDWECFCAECGTHLKYSTFACSPPSWTVKQGTAVHYHPKEAAE
jgi:RNase P subunit RPR2